MFLLARLSSKASSPERAFFDSARPSISSLVQPMLPTDRTSVLKSSVSLSLEASGTPNGTITVRLEPPYPAVRESPYKSTRVGRPGPDARALAAVAGLAAAAAKTLKAMVASPIRISGLASGASSVLGRLRRRQNAINKINGPVKNLLAIIIITITLTRAQRLLSIQLHNLQALRRCAN